MAVELEINRNLPQRLIRILGIEAHTGNTICCAALPSKDQITLATQAIPAAALCEKIRPFKRQDG